MEDRKTTHNLAPLALGAAIICFPGRPTIAQVSVAKFHRDFSGALVFTFDDALPSQLMYAAPYLDQVGLKGSFYLITRNIVDGTGAPAIGKPTTWTGWKALANNGHEIGSHTLTHANLTQVAADQAARELSESALAIKDKLGITPVTLAYPFNAWNPSVAAESRKTYMAFRDFQVGYGNVSGFANTAAAMNKYADDAVTGKRAQVGMIHGLGEPYAPMDPAVFLEHLKYCRKLADEGKLWVARFCDLIKYQKERDSLRVTVKAQTAVRVEFLAECPLDPVAYDFPLTLKVVYTGAVPAKAVAMRAGQAAPLPVEIQPGRILVQAAPGPGLITVDWSGGTGLAPGQAQATPRKGSPRKFIASGRQLQPVQGRKPTPEFLK